MDIHFDVEPLGFLIGKWAGEGRGIYPTIENFTYRERISIESPPGKPFLVYRQQTWRAGNHPEAGSALHTECGYMRPGTTGRAELVLAQPTGVAEIHDGAIAGTTIAFSATSIATTATAKEIRSVERNLAVTGRKMVYEVLIGAVGEPHQIHLEASLERLP